MNEACIILTVNRHAGPAFARWMFFKHQVEIQEYGDVLDDHKPVTILTLTPQHFNLFRSYLTQNLNTLENAAGILKGLGQPNEETV